MINRRFLTYLLLMTTVLLLASGFTVFAESAPRMSSDELNTRIGEEDLVILDVRAGGDWAGSNDKIKGAVRVDPSRVNQWLDVYDKEKTIVLYCA